MALRVPAVHAPPNTRRSALAAALCVALALTPSVAFARQAKVDVFEAHAFAEPRGDAEIVETFVEGVTLSVAEEADGDWVRVRLSSGGTGWIRLADLAIGREPVAVDTVVLRPPAPAPAPEPEKAKIFIKDFDHLTELVREDPVVYARALEVQEDIAAAKAWSWGTLAGGLLLAIIGLALPEVEAADSDYTHETDDTLNKAFVVSGLTLLVVGPTAALIVSPSYTDVLEVKNMWNRRHPDEPFTVGGMR